MATFSRYDFKISAMFESQKRLEVVGNKFSFGIIINRKGPPSNFTKCASVSRQFPDKVRNLPDTKQFLYIYIYL